jgi:uncharacterized membrane protein
MGDADYRPEDESGKIAKLPLLAAVLALVGLLDSAYLTINHYTGEKVPCGLTGGCEVVLSSQYSEIAGIPLAAFGALAYFAAFSFAILAAFGNRAMWKIFGILTIVMAGFSAYLLYLQAFVISPPAVPFVERFCQFCLLSAATSITLFIIALASRFWRR